MSHDARVWAKRQQLNDSSAKHLLKTFADWAAEDYSVWVSSDELQADTEMNPKTISKYTAVLVGLGYLRDSGLRQGRTRQITVYQMTAPAGSIQVQTHDRRTGVTKTYGPPDVEAFDDKAPQKRKPSKNGGVKAPQKRKPSKNGSLPNLDLKPPKFGVKAPQKRTESPPNLVDDRFKSLREVRESRAGARDAPPLDDETDNPKTGTPGFDRFWDIWPASTGRKTARGACLERWKAAALEPHTELIVAHVAAMKLTSDWRRGFEPTPMRYLEETRWRDGPPMPPAAESSSCDLEKWWTSASATEQVGRSVDVEKRENEIAHDFLVRVAKAKGRGPWIDFVLREALHWGGGRYQQIVEFFGDALLPVDFHA